MTEEEYIELCAVKAAERAREEAKRTIEYWLYPSEVLNDYFCANNITKKEHDAIKK